MHIAYDGPLSDLLEHVTSNFGVSWRYDGTGIVINRMETRTFVIEALPGTQSIADGIDNSNSSGGSGSSSGGGGSSSPGGSSSSGSGATAGTVTQSTKFSFDLKYWDELGQILNAMVAGSGSVVTLSPSVGTVTVTATPDNHPFCCGLYCKGEECAAVTANRHQY